MFGILDLAPSRRLPKGRCSVIRLRRRRRNVRPPHRGPPCKSNRPRCQKFEPLFFLDKRSLSN